MVWELGKENQKLLQLPEAVPFRALNLFHRTLTGSLIQVKQDRKFRAETLLMFWEVPQTHQYLCKCA